MCIVKKTEMMYVPHLVFYGVKFRLWVFCSRSQIADSFPCPFHSWLRPLLTSYKCPFPLPVVPESLAYSQTPGLIAHLHGTCGLLLFRKECKCKQHTTPEQVIGICQSLFSWKSLFLITTITAQFVIHVRTQRELLRPIQRPAIAVSKSHLLS